MKEEGKGRFLWERRRERKDKVDKDTGMSVSHFERSNFGPVKNPEVLLLYEMDDQRKT